MNRLTVFRKGGWDPAGFRYVYSPKCRSFPRFAQEDGCIVNRRGPNSDQYEYISILSGRKHATGTALTTRCSFETYGAPLIVITDDVRRGPTGEFRFGVHWEIVAYEGGVNVWRLEPEKDDVRPECLARKKFPVSAGKIHRLTVRPEKGALAVSLDGNAFSVAACVPAEFYAGVTACEGIDRFFDFLEED